MQYRHKITPLRWNNSFHGISLSAAGNREGIWDFSHGVSNVGLRQRQICICPWEYVTCRTLTQITHACIFMGPLRRGSKEEVSESNVWKRTDTSIEYVLLVIGRYGVEPSRKGWGVRLARVDRGASGSAVIQFRGLNIGLCFDYVPDWFLEIVGIKFRILHRGNFGEIEY